MADDLQIYIMYVADDLQTYIMHVADELQTYIMYVADDLCMGRVGERLPIDLQYFVSHLQLRLVGWRSWIDYSLRRSFFDPGSTLPPPPTRSLFQIKSQIWTQSMWLMKMIFSHN